MPPVNPPELLAELTAASDRYESALVSNQVEILQELFWNSPQAVRFGITENLYGQAEIETFRKSRPPTGLARTILRRQIVCLGGDTGMVNLEFRRTTDSGFRDGRQSQVWRRLPEGWRIMAAHVSWLSAK